MAKNYLREYLLYRPFHVALLRATEAEFYASLEFKHPILDIGFGDGFFASVVFRKKIDVGIDVSEKYLKEAKECGAYENLIIADVKRIPYSDNFFSTVVANCTLEHVSNLKKALGEIYRVLKPNGSFVCTVMTDNFNKFSLGVAFFKALRLYPLAEFYTKYLDTVHFHKNLYSKKRWRKVLETAGFVVVSEQPYFSKQAVRLFDTLHWLGYFTFISKLLFDRWVLFPKKIKLLPIEKFLKKYTKKKDLKEGAAVFYLCTKL